MANFVTFILLKLIQYGALVLGVAVFIDALIGGF